MKNYWLLLLLLPVIIIQSCSDPSEPGSTPVDKIAEFINSQRLPSAQQYRVTFSNTDEDCKVFIVKYGEPFDCPSGCAYSVATGLYYKNHIGWLAIEAQFPDTGVIKHPYYDITGNEFYLFSQNFWVELEVKEWWGYHYGLLTLFAKDKDTPVPVLKRMAEELYTFINDYLAGLILDNPNIRTSREVLTILANLPVFQGDAYNEERARAKKMLDEL